MTAWKTHARVNWSFPHDTLWYILATLSWTNVGFCSFISFRQISVDFCIYCPLTCDFSYDRHHRTICISIMRFLRRETGKQRHDGSYWTVDKTLCRRSGSFRRFWPVAKEQYGRLANFLSNIKESFIQKRMKGSRGLRRTITCSDLICRRRFASALRRW